MISELDHLSRTATTYFGVPRVAVVNILKKVSYIPVRKVGRNMEKLFKRLLFLSIIFFNAEQS